MRARIRLTGMLLAALLALSTPLDRWALIDKPSAAPVPSAVLASVRGCLAAIDLFIVDGNLETLWETLDTMGHGLDPWPPTDHARRDVAALAFRATFPRFHLALADISQSNGAYTAKLNASGTSGSTPTWLSLGTGSYRVAEAVDFDIDETGAIVRSGVPHVAGPLALSLPSVGIPFRLDTPTRLVGAQFTLTPSQRGERYLAVEGPGLVIPMTGMLKVEGEGHLFVYDRARLVWHALAVDESIVIGPGDLVYLPDGYAVLTMTTADPAVLYYASVVPVTPKPNDEPEGGKAAPASLAALAAGANAPTKTWFGSIDSVKLEDDIIPAGMTTLSLTWILAPQDSSIETTAGQSSLVTLDPWETLRASDSASGIDQFDLTRLLLAVNASRA